MKGRRFRESSNYPFCAAGFGQFCAWNDREGAGIVDHIFTDAASLRRDSDGQ
jgi:hypothetical protein